MSTYWSDPNPPAEQLSETAWEGAPADPCFLDYAREWAEARQEDLLDVEAAVVERVPMLTQRFYLGWRVERWKLRLLAWVRTEASICALLLLTLAAAVVLWGLVYVAYSPGFWQDVSACLGGKLR